MKVQLLLITTRLDTSDSMIKRLNLLRIRFVFGQIVLVFPVRSSQDGRLLLVLLSLATSAVPSVHDSKLYCSHSVKWNPLFSPN